MSIDFNLPNELYHYTSLETFKLILENQLYK